MKDSSQTLGVLGKLKSVLAGSAALVALAAAGTGCQPTKTAGAGETQVTEVAAVAPADPQPSAPVVDQPISDVPTRAGSGGAAAASSTVSGPVAPSAGARKYTVQKGDTLWKIAQKNYGNGKEYNRIVAANPGLSASSLKAGQTLNIP